MNLLEKFGPVGGEKGEVMAYFFPSLLFFYFLNRAFKYKFLLFGGWGGFGRSSLPFPSPLLARELGERVL